MSASANPHGWQFLRSAPAAAAVNMATDETLLQAMPVLQRPVLRWYGWTEPAATFGYFQHYADVSALTPLRPLVRRPTGGGIVPHDRDWTYSLVFPAGHDWHRLRAIESYRAVHSWLRDAFAELGVQTFLAPTPRKSSAGQCFVGYEEADLLLGTSKIAGAAQRRNRLGLLIQGSVQPPDGLARARWEEAMLAVMARQGTQWSPLELSDELQQVVMQLAREKYGTDAFNRKR